MRRLLTWLFGPLCASLALLVAAVGCSGGFEEDSLEPSGIGQGPTFPVAFDDPSGRTIELVYESIRVLDKDEHVVSSSERGRLTLHDWQRAARPWTYRSEAYLYQKEAWQR